MPPRQVMPVPAVQQVHGAKSGLRGGVTELGSTECGWTAAATGAAAPMATVTTAARPRRVLFMVPPGAEDGCFPGHEARSAQGCGQPCPHGRWVRETAGRTGPYGGCHGSGPLGGGAGAGLGPGAVASSRGPDA